MKIQLNGFDIEIDTSDTEMMVKVIDANGQELSNNTYSQSLDTSDDVEDVEIPGLDEEDGLDEEEEGLDEEGLDDEGEESTESEDLDLDDEDLDLDLEDDEESDEDDITFDENKVYDFTEFKKLSESNKRKLNKKSKTTK